MWGLCGCSTGIESTKTITPTRHERREFLTTPEDTVMNSIRLTPLGEWRKGRPFLVTDNKALLIYDSNEAVSLSGATPHILGHVFRFSHTSERLTPGGKHERLIVFNDSLNTFTLAAGKTPAEADTSFSPLDTPMLIDLETVEQAAQLLTGKKLWTRSPLRYDASGEKINGRRFVPVTIIDVQPGDLVFPLHLTVEETDGSHSIMYMSISNTGLESRTFPSLFFLSDPKSRYPSIHQDVWELIQQGRVRVGMTKDECRLSLGNPNDVNSGHDWSNTIDIWSYKDGAFLRFQDGLLIYYRM